MTFLEAALVVLRREGKPLHYKDIADRAVAKGLLTMVGRTPAITMQTQLQSAINKSPGNPFVRAKPGFFGLLRYPQLSPDELAAFDDLGRPATGVVPPRVESESTEPRQVESRPAIAGGADRVASDGRGGRSRRRGRRGRGGSDRPEETEDLNASNGGGSDLDERDLPEGESNETTSAVEGIKISPMAAASVLPAVEGSDGEDADLAGDDGPEGEEGDGPEGEGDGPGTRRRRRRRRRRRGGELGLREGGAEIGAEVVREEFDGPPAHFDASQEGGEFSGENPSARPSAESEGESDGGDEGGPSPSEGESRRILAPLDAAIEILTAQAPGRGVHVRQIADAAVRRRLIHGESHEAWRVVRAALAAEPRERLRNGQRPRIRAAGSGLFALARRPADMDLERAEQVFGEARRALRERTLASLEQRLGELSSGAFEAIARVLLQREGFGPATFVKRVEGTVYVEASRGRGFKPSRCLIGLRGSNSAAGRRSVGELRAGVRARGLDEGVLLLAGRLAEDGISEWKQPGPPVEVVDGPALADVCVRHGIGVHNANVSVDFVDADFFAELAEG